MTTQFVLTLVKTSLFRQFHYYEDGFSVRLQKTSSRRLDQDEYIHLTHMSTRRLDQDQYIRLGHTSSRRLQDIFKTSSRRLQVVFKMSC